MPRFVQANPYAWPWNGDLTNANTALLVIEFEHLAGLGKKS